MLQAAAQPPEAGREGREWHHEAETREPAARPIHGVVDRRVTGAGGSQGGPRLRTLPPRPPGR